MMQLVDQKDGSMKISSWNVNGIRACIKKGFFDYVNNHSPDVLCLQETKISEADIQKENLEISGYQSCFFPAQKKGYSGTAIYFKGDQGVFKRGFGMPEFDSEGRVVQLDIDKLSIFSVYFPNGQRDHDRLDYKLRFYESFFNYCDQLRAEGRSIVVAGDFNTAHCEIDLANPQTNQQTSGFLPIERAWIDRIIQNGYVDTFRLFCNQPDHYSWWTYRFGARDRNIGWRIDYQFVSNDLQSICSNATIESQVKGSDHCPVHLELAYESF